ncbi:3-oxoadipate enol-lactonase [Calidithermus terrae]|uniref:3-oxoadipate enol-lactonase n=1 Tax=Calidithermus terrae TaxID=1408545 RepID=A0A399E353_9DEIN|nr:alpha/beta hydrolase [Calidithermus terrae]RIH78288.1 3-oxoadipate enol-lactonase [Calidithermus terrae]
METVVFLPGLLAPPAGFRSLRENLEGLRCIELAPHATPAEGLEAWRGEVPPGAHLVAFAEAAWAGAQLAAQSQAKSLTLLSPVLRVDAALRARLRALEQALGLGPEAFVTAAKPWLFGPVLLEHGHEAMAAWAEGLREGELGRWLAALSGLPDGRRALRGLRCPVLVVIGAEDVFTPSRYAQEAVEWVPEQRAMRVSLEATGHLAPWENPGEALAVLAAFLRDAEGFLQGPPAWHDGLDELPVL